MRTRDSPTAFVERHYGAVRSRFRLFFQAIPPYRKKCRESPVLLTNTAQPHPGTRLRTETQSINQRRVGRWSGSFSTPCRQDRLATAIGGTLTVTTLAYSEHR